MPVIDERKKEYCGVFGISDHEMAVEMAYLGLYSLQHRGEESCGIAVSNGERIEQLTGNGTRSGSLFSR